MGMSAHGQPNDDVVKLIKDFYNSFDLVPQEQLRMMRNTFNNTQINNIKNIIRNNVQTLFQNKIKMNLPLGTPNMTYDIVKIFFKNIKNVSKISPFDIAIITKVYRR